MRGGCGLSRSSPRPQKNGRLEGTLEFGDGSEDLAFRLEVRGWLAEHVALARDRRGWERVLGAAGWVGLGWGE
ncbi:hypothetical protein ACFFS2_05070, partial [Streptomyces aurantiacus]